MWLYIIIGALYIPGPRYSTGIWILHLINKILGKYFTRFWRNQFWIDCLKSYFKGLNFWNVYLNISDRINKKHGRVAVKRQTDINQREAHIYVIIMFYSWYSKHSTCITTDKQQHTCLKINNCTLTYCLKNISQILISFLYNWVNLAWL